VFNGRVGGHHIKPLPGKEPLGEFDWQQGFDLRVLIPNLVVVEGGDLGRALQKQKSLQPRMK
jgi:hypothetical protein